MASPRFTKKLTITEWVMLMPEPFRSEILQHKDTKYAGYNNWNKLYDNPWAALNSAFSWSSVKCNIEGYSWGMVHSQLLNGKIPVDDNGLNENYSLW